MTIWRIIFCVSEVLLCGVLLLEGYYERSGKDHKHNCAPSHLPNIGRTIDTSISFISTGLKCMLCGSAQCSPTMVLSNVCSTGLYIECFNLSKNAIPNSC